MADARLRHPWLGINRVLRAMLHERWSAEAWPQVKAEFKEGARAQESDPARVVVPLPIGRRLPRLVCKTSRGGIGNLWAREVGVQIDSHRLGMIRIALRLAVIVPLVGCVVVPASQVQTSREMVSPLALGEGRKI